MHARCICTIEERMIAYGLYLRDKRKIADEWGNVHHGGRKDEVKSKVRSRKRGTVYCYYERCDFQHA